MTIHEQEKQGCRAFTAAVAQNINQMRQYSKVHVIAIKTQCQSSNCEFLEWLKLLKTLLNNSEK